MKVHHFSILFSILFFGLFWMESWKGECADMVSFQKASMDLAIERAADGAARQLATYCDGGLYVDYEKVLDSFLSNLYAGLGILEYIPMQKQVLAGITFFLVADEEGIYLWHAVEDGEGVREGWIWERQLFEPGEEYAAWLERQLTKAAEQYGKKDDGGESYAFLLPDQDENLWLRGVEGPCVMVFLQGIPAASDYCYEKFLFSGAVVHKTYTY